MNPIFAEPTEWWLDIPPHLQTECWQVSQQYASPSRRHSVYLNYLCLQVFLPWFQQEYAPDVTVWPDANDLFSIWEMVNGSHLTFATQHIVLLPTDTLDSDGIDVPQEWVDLPNWAANYYLALQLDLDEHWIRIWGYTTHHTLKQQGTYDKMDRMYTLKAHQLTCDLNAFWIICQFCPDAQTQADIAALPTLSNTQMQQAIHQLSRTDIAFPRLATSFQQWGAIIAHHIGRQQLYQQRLQSQRLQSIESTEDGIETQTNLPDMSIDSRSTISKAVTNLNNWLQGTFEPGWQALETWLGENAIPTYRRAGDTGHSFRACQQRIKFITLTSESGPQTLILLIALHSDTNECTGIRVQVHSIYRKFYIPAGLELAIHSHTGQTLQSVCAGKQTNYIQLPVFKCKPGIQFRLQVTLSEDTFSEVFTI